MNSKPPFWAPLAYLSALLDVGEQSILGRVRGRGAEEIHINKGVTAIALAGCHGSIVSLPLTLLAFLLTFFL
jgi:hypothetical protein